MALAGITAFSYTMLLIFSFSRPVPSQLIYKEDKDVDFNNCPADIYVLPAKVTNLQKHDWSKMIIFWKYNKSDVYSFNGETGKHINKMEKYRLQDLVKEKVEEGDVSLHFLLKPPAGEYICETTEVSTEGSKIVIVSHNPIPLIRNVGLVIAVLVIAACLFVIEALIDLLYWKLREIIHISAYCVGGVGVVFIVVGLYLIPPATSWEITQRAGLGIAVILSLFLILIFEGLLLYSFKAYPLKTVLLSLFAAQAITWVIASIAAIVCTTDCPPKPSAVVTLIIGLLLFIVIQLSDVIFRHYVQCKKAKEDAGRNQNGKRGASGR